MTAASLLSEIEQLKESSYNTMESLQRLRENQEALRDATQALLEHVEISEPNYDSETEIITIDSSNSSLNSSISSTNDSTADYIIKTMWDDFSIDQYPLTSPAKRQSPPRVTIPRPFSMTLRENCKVKKKSRSLEIAEREKLEGEAIEEMELHKQFKANPVPVTTFLPLYEMINACNERRREEVKENCQRLLKESERPFSFIRREREKEKMQKYKKQQEEEQEHLTKKQRQFRAKPVPKKLFNPTVKDEIEELEEYRKIRIRLRALEMLASSHLPNNMSSKNSQQSVGKLRKMKRDEMDKASFLTVHHSFHPSINETVPDHRESYENFKDELLRRKQHKKPSTKIEPFDLRTDKRMTIRRHKALESKMSSNQQKGPNNKVRPMIPTSFSDKSFN